MSVEMKSVRPIIADEKSEVPENGSYDNAAYANEKGFDSLDERTAPGQHGYSLEMDADDDYEYDACQRGLLSIQDGLHEFYTAHNKVIWTMIGLIVFIAYFVYVGLALNYKFGDEGSWRLLGFTLFGVLLLVLVKLYNAYETEVDTWWEGTSKTRDSKGLARFNIFIRWFLRVGVFVAVVVYIVLDIAIDHPGNLVSVAGLALYIIIFYFTSINPARVNWHTVFWGIALQYVFALMILRTKWGFDMFKWLGDRVTEFLEYVMTGVIFVYGDSWADHFFATKVIAIVIFFFTFINIMYYLGVMQAVIKVMGRFLAFCMGTTPAESINAAANIFVSMTESPLMIRPFLKDMTKSELHAVMTGGFATIAGSVLGAYISFGVPANHLLSASVMSAPAALAISKLSYPETEKSKATSKDFGKMEKAPEHNIIEAASNGASASVKICAAVIVNVIAFLSLLAFLNATLTWFGDRVGIDNLTFEYICSYVLYPVSFFMGVETDDCRKVAELVGVKTFTNEFIAYGNLKVLIANRHSLDNYTSFYNTTDWFWEGGNVVLNITNEVLETGFISEKSEIIATYALCGFANFGSIGITLGGLGALVPTRKTELAQIVVRAMICGNVACFLTACIAARVASLAPEYDPLRQFLYSRRRRHIVLTHGVAVYTVIPAGVKAFAPYHVLSIVMFFFTVINILYYLGVMQVFITVIGRFLAFCMGTTPAESLNAAANIFLSMVDGPMMIRPFLKDMTRSELHAVMTGGFATIAGSVLGAYITFGIPANHLLSASVMSAPAALAISKLSYPETEKSKASSKDFGKLEKAPEHNIIEAASNGASGSVKICGAIIVNVIAFLSLLAFLNATLTWFGDRIGIDGLTFELICSYVLFPLSFFMGVDTGDCRKVAELIGVKTFTNEFIAYGHLKDLIANRQSLNNYTSFYNTTDWFWQDGHIVLNITQEVLTGGFISEKSEIIATYALCGFANFGSIGITLGGVGALIPSRKADLAQMVVRAMICGNVACFLTACIAGLLYKPY